MWKAIGRITVTTSGTPVNLAANIHGQTMPCQTIFVQQIEANSGKIYLLDQANGDKQTRVLATIPAPTKVGGVATFLPWAACTVPNERNALNVSQIWVDADNSGESCQVSVIGSFTAYGNR